MFGDAPPALIVLDDALLEDDVVDATAEAVRRQLARAGTWVIAEPLAPIQDALARRGIALPQGSKDRRTALVEGSMADAFLWADAMEVPAISWWVGDGDIDLGDAMEQATRYGIRVIVDAPSEVHAAPRGRRVTP